MALDWKFVETGWVAGERGGGYRVTLLGNGTWELDYPFPTTDHTGIFATVDEAKAWAEQEHRRHLTA
ncbi:hypothetical protein [Luteimicrobium subarcticum]|uniref:Uncharacterized protein n=1 Tax=Luteimicrobium subarcticum TaxID=620910 RepID=A0A2M8WRP7_9MICO|nr:hypothetical protein [Luteimicrobium subarcticum]PJI93516.1 hypothetical protein CLV34_2090 [Luteimicrobium subarcticum]